MCRSRARVQAAFTFTTTHHREVKDESRANASFVNAAVQFNVETLSPTYKLVWDELGASNALAVAQTLGFDRTVVAAGRDWKERLATLQQAAASGRKISAALDVRARCCLLPGMRL
jgi:dsDNA-specific endonuclease/ATPase MutS2